MTFLRRTLMIDAAISGASGLLLAFAATPLQTLLGVPEGMMRYAGLSLIPFAAALLYLAMRPVVSVASVSTIIALNIAWVVASVAVLFAIDPKPLGYAFIIVQAIAVIAFAELQYVGLRRA